MLNVKEDWLHKELNQKIISKAKKLASQPKPEINSLPNSEGYLPDVLYEDLPELTSEAEDHLFIIKLLEAEFIRIIIASCFDGSKKYYPSFVDDISGIEDIPFHEPRHIQMLNTLKKSFAESQIPNKNYFDSLSDSTIMEYVAETIATRYTLSPHWKERQWGMFDKENDDNAKQALYEVRLKLRVEYLKQNISEQGVLLKKCTNPEFEKEILEKFMFYHSHLRSILKEKGEVLLNGYLPD